MAKKLDMLNAMRSTARSAPRAAEIAVAERPARETSSEERSADPHFRPGRSGKSNVTGYFPPVVKKQLRMIAAEHDKTIQRLLAEALNDLFVKYGKPEAAPLDDEA